MAIQGPVVRRVAVMSSTPACHGAACELEVSYQKFDMGDESATRLE
jgi:hypothetical protein